MGAFEILDNPEIPNDAHGKFPLSILLVGVDVYPGKCWSKGIFPSFSSHFKLKLLKRGVRVDGDSSLSQKLGKEGIHRDSRAMDPWITKLGRPQEGLENSKVVEDPR